MDSRKAVGAVVVLAALLVLSSMLPRSATAELQPVAAEIVRTVGPVSVLRKGASQWVPGTAGMQLVDGDQIRALGGGAADLHLPDGSTIFVAENTRFAVVKLEYDAKAGTRTTAFHLMVGKVRAEVTKASLQLVRTRQSNFTISTPAGVAAVRGTVMVVTYESGAGGAAQGGSTQLYPRP
jgi:hypothetical protein